MPSPYPPLPSGTAAPNAGRVPARTLAKQRRVFSGRVASLPAFTRMRNGTLVARFRLRVRQLDGECQEHVITAFGKEAVQLRDSLRLGQEVSVSGYEHTRRKLNPKTGTVQVLTELYLVCLTT